MNSQSVWVVALAEIFITEFDLCRHYSLSDLIDRNWLIIGISRETSNTAGPVQFNI